MGPVGMCSRVLRELADVIARSLPIIFETSWRLEEIPEEMKKIIFILVFKKGRKEISEKSVWSDPHTISISEGDGANNPGNNFLTYDRQEDD